MSVIVVDWDETITESDTIGILADTAYTYKPEYKPTFEYFSNVYMKAFNKYQSVKPSSFDQEIEYQKGLEKVEMTSIEAIEKHNLFKGITAEDIRKQATKVQLRSNFVSFINTCGKLRIPVKILSINWTSVLIREALALHGVKDVEIYSNELELDNGVCTGRFDPNISIRTGFDKYTQLEKLGLTSRAIYIGDSRTDLLSLLSSQIGIIIENGSLLKKLPWKIQTKPLEHYDANSSSLYIGNWGQITRFIIQRHSDQFK